MHKKEPSNKKSRERGFRARCNGEGQGVREEIGDQRENEVRDAAHGRHCGCSPERKDQPLKDTEEMSDMI